MSHKWSEIKCTLVEFVRYGGSHHIIIKAKECIYCGLRKGLISPIVQGNITIYYRDREILSIGRLPYKCTKNYFLKEEDFIL